VKLKFIIVGFMSSLMCKYSVRSTYLRYSCDTVNTLGLKHLTIALEEIVRGLISFVFFWSI